MVHADDWSKYAKLRDAGFSPVDVYRRARDDGIVFPAIVRLLRDVFDCEVWRAKEIMLQGDGAASSLDEHMRNLLPAIEAVVRDAEREDSGDTTLGDSDMAIRYTVYCKQPVGDVTPDQLLAGVRIVDLHTIAGNDDVLEETILDALSQLRMENLDSGKFRFYRLCYRASGKRQIDVERWQTADEVRSVVAEVLEDLQCREHPALARIRTHLEHTVDIVDASFGSMPGEAMAPILASEVARWLAETFDGIIRAADDSWWELGVKHHEYRPLKP